MSIPTQLKPTFKITPISGPVDVEYTYSSYIAAPQPTPDSYPYFSMRPVNNKTVAYNIGRSGPLTVNGKEVYNLFKFTPTNPKISVVGPIGTAFPPPPGRYNLIMNKDVPSGITANTIVATFNLQNDTIFPPEGFALTPFKYLYKTTNSILAYNSFYAKLNGSGPQINIGINSNQYNFEFFPSLNGIIEPGIYTLYATNINGDVKSMGSFTIINEGLDRVLLVDNDAQEQSIVNLSSIQGKLTDGINVVVETVNSSQTPNLILTGTLARKQVYRNAYGAVTVSDYSDSINSNTPTTTMGSDVNSDPILATTQNMGNVWIAAQELEVRGNLDVFGGLTVPGITTTLLDLEDMKINGEYLLDYTDGGDPSPRGYYKLPGKFIIQFGYCSYADSPQFVFFRLPFAVFYGIQATRIGVGGDATAFNYNGDPPVGATSGSCVGIISLYTTDNTKIVGEPRNVVYASILSDVTNTKYSSFYWFAYGTY
jgi:hypothetical protein